MRSRRDQLFRTTLALILLGLIMLFAAGSEARQGKLTRVRPGARALVRPTPTAPRMTGRQLQKLGIKMYVNSKSGRLVACPGKDFKAAEARKAGLIVVKGKSGSAHLRHIKPGKALTGARTALYPRARRTFASSYRPPAKGRVKVAFFDADSTLRITRSGGVAADSGHDYALLPGAAAKMKQLSRDGYLIAVVSNQAGVKAGFINKQIADGGLRNMARALSAEGAPVHYYDFAMDYNRDRKPRPGMAERLARQVHGKFGKQVDWKGSIMVGDSAWKRGKDLQPDGRPGTDFSNSDRRFADSVRKTMRSPAGVKFHHPKTFFGWQQNGVEGFKNVRAIQKYNQANSAN